MMIPRPTGKLYACLGIFLLLSFAVCAQSGSVKGSVTDTLSKISLHNAVVYLKDPKDSSLVFFTRADAKGGFAFPSVKDGRYIMVVTYPGYVDWIDTIQVADKPLQVPVFLYTTAHILQEVIVKQTVSPIRIKGDTTEFLVDSFHVKPGATVEDLLKVLPGFTVNSKGEITAQGQKVQKVLVDGDEFFGDDPTMATQNLNSKDVAKVQLYDRKSDQATLTGIDDGSKQKTLNLVLKEDAKKGYFGSATAGTDFNQYYQSKFSASRFTSTLKAGILVTADRTGRNGMNWEEMQDYGSITTTVENGNASFSWEGDDEFSPWGNQEGIPENLQTAIMLNKKFGKLKSSTASNYSYNHLDLSGEGYTNTKYVLKDTVNFNNQTQASSSQKWKQTLSTRNEFNLDSLTTVTVNAKISNGRNHSYNTQDGAYLTGDGVPLNTSKRTNTSSGDSRGDKADIFLRRKLNAAGTRSVTLSAGMTHNYTNSEGYLFNQTDFYTAGLPSSQLLVDQLKRSHNETKTSQLLASYTEPLNKRLSLNLNYTFNTSNNDQDTRSYEKSNGKYDSLNLLFSNHYQFNQSSHRAGFVFNYITKNTTARIGLAVQDLSMKQTNLYKDSSYARNFTNFFPTANWRWKFSSSGNISINYYGYSQQPSLMDLQPILNNNDPLNIVQGNQNLRPGFTHQFSMNYGNYKTLSNRGVWIWGSIQFNENAFTNKSTIDGQGKRTTQTVNVNGNYRYNLDIEMNRQIKFMKLDLMLEPTINGGRRTNFVNGQENVTRNIHLEQTVRLSRYVEKKWDFSMNYSAGFDHSSSSINTGAVTEYWTHKAGIDMSFRLKHGWQLSTDARYTYRQKISDNDRNNEMTVWNASIEKKLFKKQDITAIFTMNDILNQRVVFNRDITSNYVTESSFTSVRRYAMLSLRWKFNKNRKTSSDDDDDD